MKKSLLILLCLAMLATMLAGCRSETKEETTAASTTAASASTSSAVASTAASASSSQAASALADGTYDADFTTDSKMFHVNEAKNGKGVLTVQGGKMTIHVSLVSENIVNLFAGTAADAQKSGAALLQPTKDTVTYSDGTTEEVYGFDIPVPAIDQEFAVAILGTKGTWYDHQVKVSNPTPAAAASGDSDQAAADKVAALIDAIYVQTRNDQTDQQCADAKAAWDALTDAQKALVEGEHASPEYFGRDTGDASQDDPLNEDKIGENELLVVSFGTSFNDSRVKDVGGVEKALQAAYPDWSVRRAFTAQIIINHIQARDGEKIDNMDQALDRAVANGVKNLVVQPTHLMHGAEYDELVEAVNQYKDKFASVQVSEPLLGEVGENESEINADKEAVAKAITAQAVKAAGFGSLDEAAKAGTAFVFMGHGTSHKANVTYDQMQTQVEKLGYKNVFIGTVEGKPADTACQAVIEKVKAAGCQNVVLRPLMVVAGDHANNDMAGDDSDSWKSQFTAANCFTKIDCQIAGLGEIPEIQQMYVAHAGAIIGK
jgi:cobalamin biosynthesis Co2+ chelatase CbiK